MPRACPVCGRDLSGQAQAPQFSFWVGELERAAGTEVCPSHEVRHACKVCGKSTANREDPICEECRSDVEF
ncbi:MAG: hypothetical protein ACF8XB_09770 [Planctomycetota bacterium JB042]